MDSGQIRPTFSKLQLIYLIYSIKRYLLKWPTSKKNITHSHTNLKCRFGRKFEKNDTSMIRIDYSKTSDTQ